MKMLPDIEAELLVAADVLERARIACRQLQGSDAKAIGVVLFEAHDKVREVIEDLSDYQIAMHVPFGGEQ